MQPAALPPGEAFRAARAAPPRGFNVRGWALATIGLRDTGLQLREKVVTGRPRVTHLTLHHERSAHSFSATRAATPCASQFHPAGKSFRLFVAHCDAEDAGYRAWPISFPLRRGRGRCRVFFRITLLLYHGVTLF